MNITKLRLDVTRHAEESAKSHLKFVMAGNEKAWWAEHADELNRAFQHFATIGANEAINHLVRNNLLKP